MPDTPADDKPAPKAKPAAKTGLADAAASTDPAVMKLMWDRGHTESAGDTEFAHVAADHNERRLAAIDAELRKLGFDI